MDFNLTLYLKKFERFLPYEARVRNAVITAIKESLDVDIDRKMVRVSRENVFVTGSSALRSELLVRQEVLLKMIREMDSSVRISRIQ